MKNLSETKKYLLIMILIDLLIGGVCVFILNNFWNGRLAEIDNLNIKLASLQAGSKTAATVSRILKETQADRDRLNLYFINSETTQNFIEELENAATAVGVQMKINSLSVAKEGGNKGPSYLRVSFEVDGSFSGVFHYQKVIESLPYKIRINELSMLKTGDKISPWHSQTTIDLLSYSDK